MKPGYLLIGLLALPACQAPTANDLVASDSCGTARYGALMGQPESAIEAISFNQPVRITRPRSSVTTDFVADRLNFVLDGSGSVAAITCG